MNATSQLISGGPTATHPYPCIVTREGVPYGTLLGWAETEQIAEQARLDFLAAEPVSLDDLLNGADE